MLVRSLIQSSTIKRVGYDIETQNLELLFTSGAIYLYKMVPPETVHALLIARSKGEYFNHHIRDFFEASKVVQ